MPQQVRMWEITQGDSLVEIASPGIDRENRLESWLESDISMLDPDLLVIGRQVRTDFGGVIDLLCMDSAGGLVVVELKRDQAPRDVTTQVLDYASWVKNLRDDDIRGIASSYRQTEGSLEEAFDTKFDQPLPNELNLTHRSLIVAEAMDAGTERIVRYLSDLGVPINVATVQHFKAENGLEMLAQVYLIEPEEAAIKEQSTSKGRGRPNAAQMATIASERGVGELYLRVSNKALGILNAASFGKESRGFRVKNPAFEKPVRWLAVFVVELGESDAEKGLAFRLNGTRLMNIFGLNCQQLKAILPQEVADMSVSDWHKATPEEIDDWHGRRGYFRTGEEVDKFTDGLRAAAGQ